MPSDDLSFRFPNSIGWVFGSTTQGSKSRQIQSHLRLNLFPLRLKYREVANLQLIFTSVISKQKDYQLPICCHFNKVKKEITKLLFLAVNFFQSEDTLTVAYFSCDVTSFEHGVKRSSLCNLSGFFTLKYCRLIFCFAKPLTRKCGMKILRLRVAKLLLNFGILWWNCDWIFFVNFEPCYILNSGG